MRGKKVLMFSFHDYCGSGYRIVEAVSLYTNHFVEYIVMFNDNAEYGFKRYPALINSNNKDGVPEISQIAIERFQNIVNDVDIVHFKGDSVPMRKLFGGAITIPEKTPIILTTSGSFFRNPGVAGFRQSPIKYYVDGSDIRTTINPDLNYPEFDAKYVPFSYDLDKFDYCWRNKETPLIMHTPSTMAKKGTAIFETACQELLEEGVNFKYKIITNMKYDEVLKRKKTATIFFDQLGCGSYGNSAVEAMAMGIPVITYLPESSKDQADGQLDNCPIINTGNSVDSVKAAIKYVLQEDLEKLSKETRAWVYKNHSYEFTAKIWDDIYEST